jgi:hypothetical protein
LRINVNLAWKKPDKYYRLLNETPVYYTALALHPAYRWNWFKETWLEKTEWIDKAKQVVYDVWIGDYAHLDVRVTSRGVDGSDSPIKRMRYLEPFLNLFGLRKCPL